MKKFKIWHIDAYNGYSDYDGPSDCNIHKDIIMDSYFSKQQVVDMYMSLLGGRSSAISKCECIGEYDAEVLSLTWKDIENIDYAIREADSELSGKYTDKDRYEQALKIFRNGKQ